MHLKLTEPCTLTPLELRNNHNLKKDEEQVALFLEEIQHFIGMKGHLALLAWTPSLLAFQSGAAALWVITFSTH